MKASWVRHEQEYLEKINTDFQKQYQQSVYTAGVPAEKVHHFKMDYSKTGKIDTTDLSPIEKVCAQALQSAEVIEICNDLIEHYSDF